MLSVNEFIKQSLDFHLFYGRIMKEHSFFLETGFTPRDASFTNQANNFRMHFDMLLSEATSLSYSKFIRGLLDPTENDLIKAANNFGNEFDKLTNEAKLAMDKTLPLKKVTNDSIKATQQVRDFNAQGTKGLLGCKVKSIILPLLGDHVLRESNHFLRLLNSFAKL